MTWFIQKAGFDQNWPAFRLATFILYALILAFAMQRHAIWGDEMQAWLIARDSGSLGDLLGTLHYEGHPALWYLLLWPLAHVSSDPRLMQGLQAAIALATVALVLWRAPFTRFTALLFPFGYFSLFEYGVKSRSYALGLLLVLLICTVWRHRRAQKLRIAVLLALLANVHALFTLLAIAWTGALCFDRLRDPAPWHQWRTDLSALAIVILGGIAAVATAWPAPDSGYAQEWFLAPSFSRLMLVIDHAGPRGEMIAALLLGVLAAAMLSWRRDPVAAVFMVLATGLIVTFFYVKYSPFLWHYGVLYAVIIAAAWMSSAAGTPLLRAGLLPGLFVLLLGFGLQRLWQDVRHPLSAGRAVAEFLIERGWAVDPIISASDLSAVPVIGYLGIRAAYEPYGNAQSGLPRTGRWESFFRLDRTRLETPDDTAILAAIARLGPVVTILLPLNRDGAALRAHGFFKVADFTNAVVTGETYAVYRPMVP